MEVEHLPHHPRRGRDPARSEPLAQLGVDGGALRARRRDRVVTRVRWTGVLAIHAGAWPAGTEMRAECCKVFTVRDGRIVRQETYDCHEPVAVRALA